VERERGAKIDTSSGLPDKEEGQHASLWNYEKENYICNSKAGEILATL
jgi:hypothetical protein